MTAIGFLLFSDLGFGFLTERLPLTNDILGHSHPVVLLVCTMPLFCVGATAVEFGSDVT